MFSMDRLGRSLVELVGALESCRSAGTSVYVHDRQIDTSTNKVIALHHFGGCPNSGVRMDLIAAQLRGLM